MWTDGRRRDAPSVSRRKRGSTGHLTSQLLLLRARGPVTSSNKVRHAASAAPLPAPAHARTRFRQFPPGHTLLLPHPPFSCPCLVSKLRHVPCLYYTLSSHTSLSRLTSRTRLAAWPVNRCDSIICPKSSVHFAPRIFSKRLCDNLLPTSYLPAHTKLSQHVYTKNAQEADSAYTCRVGKREAPGDSEEYRVAGGVTEYQGRQRHRGASGWREGAAPA